MADHTRRAFLRSAALGATGLVFPPVSRAADTLVTGTADPTLAPFDHLMTTFLAEHDVPGAVLAVTRHGKLVYARGFGLADVDRKVPVQPDGLFRIASVSKPLTAVAVLQLVDQGKAKLDDPVLKHIPLTAHVRPGGQPDPRWKTVTVRQCLHHTGGWDRDVSFDPIGAPRRVARALDKPLPVSPADVVRYMMGRPLDFDPGQRFAYSNLGYLLLGRVIESATGQGYEQYVRARVLAPLGVTRPQLGRALPEHRAAGEVRYYDGKRGTGYCLYPPRVGEQVPVPDGAQNVEGFEAHGGWIASAVDLVRFASAFDRPKACPVLSAEMIGTMWDRPPGLAGHTEKEKPRAVYYGCGWSVRPVGNGVTTWHNGLISGTSTLLVRRADGLNWAVLFNTDNDKNGKQPSGEIDPLVHRAADEVKAWPDKDLFETFLGGK